MSKYPNDGDGIALQRMADRGMDMTRSIMFEFFVHVESKEDADVISKILRESDVGDNIEIVYDEGELEEGEEMTDENREFWPSWSVYVYRKMIPDYIRVVEFQNMLGRLIGPNGTPDGWGGLQG